MVCGRKRDELQFLMLGLVWIENEWDDGRTVESIGHLCIMDCSPMQRFLKGIVIVGHRAPVVIKMNRGIHIVDKDGSAHFALGERRKRETVKERQRENRIGAAKLFEKFQQ